MARPRLHNLDLVLDTVEVLLVESGPTAVTIRAVESASGVSTGALYHNFGSRAGLLGAAWLRAGRRFLTLQDRLVDEVLAVVPADPIEAVVAAADTPIAFAERHPGSSRVVTTIRRDELLAGELPTEIAAGLQQLNTELLDVLRRLASAVWDRRDTAAVDAITTCVVDLPTAIVLNRGRLDNPVARAQLHAAVRGVLTVEPSRPT